MFISNNKLNDIKSFKIKKDNLIYVNVNYSLFENKIQIDNNIDDNCYDIYKDYLIYVKGLDTIIKDDSTLYDKSFCPGSENLFFNTIVVSSDFNYTYPYSSSLFSLYNLKTKKFYPLERLIDVYKFISKDNYVILGSDTKLFSYTLPTATPLWQFDLGGLGEYVNISNEKCSYEVRFFLGIYNDCLLVQLNNATIIWIDCNTGKQKYILNLNESYSLPKPAFYDDSFKAHIVGEKIVFLNNQRFLHINLDSFEVTIIQDYFIQERANQYRFMHNTVFKDKIYFVADYGWQYVTPSYVGVMDANNGEILWKQQLENTGGLSEAPQVSEDKLYIRTNNNVLHIFEKE
jgi:outer membrane protein assembly factor BamB